MRFKNRYYLLELQWEDGRVDESLAALDLFRVVRDTLQAACGDWGAGSTRACLVVRPMRFHPA